MPLQRGVASTAGLRLPQSQSSIRDLKIPGGSDNASVVSETFARTVKVFFYGLHQSEVKAALLRHCGLIDLQQ
jgi:hypothetical protein